MRGMTYWVAQFLLAAVTMAAILIGMDLVSGADWRANAPMSLLWGCAAASIFTVARYTKSDKP
jgi:hypothetical protein